MKEPYKRSGFIAARVDRQSARRLPRGFTLVELLVVITVISLLIALLLPSLSRATESSRRVVCLGHMRQVGLATINMGDDHHGWINGVDAPLDTPDASYPNGSPLIHLVTNYWPVKITYYLGTPVNKAYNDYNQLVMYQGCPNLARTAQPNSYTSFSGNAQFVGWGYAPMHSLYEVRHTSRLDLICEYNSWTWNTPSHLDTTNIGTAAGSLLPRHLAEGLNALYVDGHGQFLVSPNPNVGPWWDTTSGVGDWYPNAWPYGFVKE